MLHVCNIYIYIYIYMIVINSNISPGTRVARTGARAARATATVLRARSLSELHK